MYDEIERAVGGTPRRGMSVLGWIAVAFVGFSLLGVAGAVVGFLAVRAEVREVVDGFERGGAVMMSRGMSDAVAGAVAGALAGLEPEMLASDPDAGRRLLRSLQSGRLDAAELEDIIEGSLRIRTDDGDVTADLHGNEEGGELVIRSPDGDARLQLARSDEGAVLTIRADGETVRFGAGDAADRAPSWVPPVPSMPDGPEPLMSASSGRGFFGAVAWEAAAAPEAVVDAYRERLEDEGYSLRAEHSMRGGDRRSASVVGRDDESGRMVFLVATREDGTTRAVLGYREDLER